MSKYGTTLLSRDDFREGVFARDHHKCVICKAPAVDAHHVLERRLWPDGGYYLDNGASVCEKHHLEAEMTVLTVEEVREAAGIEKAFLPPQLYSDEIYDKWGNIVLATGERLRGELMGDESVQKILGQAPFQIVFRHHVKYPRTYHLPWSPGLTKDDRVMPDLGMLAEAPRVIAHVKMDGENTSMYRDFIHARSLSILGSHPSRTRVKTLHGSIAHEIPEGWRICAENLQGKHSIHYHQLKDYVYGFSIWNAENECLPWDETAEWFALLGITPCPILYDGPFDEKLLRGLWNAQHDGDPCEGYVLRIAGGYRYRDYRRAVGKYVRSNHVQTHAHWMQQYEPNVLKT